LTSLRFSSESQTAFQPSNWTRLPSLTFSNLHWKIFSFFS
jgi:hypothetical protein